MRSRLDDLIANNLRTFVFMVLGFLLFAVIAGISVFFVVLRGEERVLVPNVQGKELTQALMELQARELNPRVQLRYSQTPHDRGQILEQEPAPGSIVGVGRLIRLVVSQGALIDRVENFVGRNIETVRMDLLTFTAGTGGPLLMLREPIIFDYSPEAVGTILQQRPEAGSSITGPMHVEFVVSRGPQQAMITVPDLTGLPISDVLTWIGSAGVVFDFNVRGPWQGETGETVVQQSPPAGSTVAADTRINLTVTPPETLSEGEVFRLFTHTIAQNPFPLPVRLEALLPNGDRRLLVGVDSPGGRFAVPYRLPADSVLILSMMDREIHRETVR